MRRHRGWSRKDPESSSWVDLRPGPGRKGSKPESDRFLAVSQRLHDARTEIPSLAVELPFDQEASSGKPNLVGERRESSDHGWCRLSNTPSSADHLDPVDRELAPALQVASIVSRSEADGLQGARRSDQDDELATAAVRVDLAETGRSARSYET